MRIADQRRARTTSGSGITHPAVVKPKKPRPKAETSGQTRRTAMALKATAPALTAVQPAPVRGPGQPDSTAESMPLSATLDCSITIKNPIDKQCVS